VFARIMPEQKLRLVQAFAASGEVVAMTGDGVNDVLALKDADLGIAMGSGAGATRSVAQIVLLDDRFSVMPSVVAEGRRVLGNVERVSDLFLTKSFYAMAVSIATVLFVLPFPFLNRHLTLTTFFTIGAPAFLLALMPNTQRFRPGFFNRVLRFAVPAGLICALSAYATYEYVLHLTDATDLVDDARSAAVVTLFVVAWWVLVQVARPLNLIRGAIVGVMLAGFVLVIHLPWFSRTFALDWAPDKAGLAAVGIGVVGCALVSIAFGLSGHGSTDDPPGEPAPAVAG
jgi:cation-transporting ATPase E